MGMLRKQVFLTAEQSRRLKARAEATGLSQARIIRSALDHELSGDVAPKGWKQRLRLAAGSLVDSSHLEQVIRDRRGDTSTADPIAPETFR